MKYRAALCHSAGQVTGIVGKDIAVIPNLSPKFTAELMAAKAAVSETGGALAHLSIVARETGKTLMIMPGAVDELPPGSMVTIIPSRLEVILHSSD